MLTRGMRSDEVNKGGASSMTSECTFVNDVRLKNKSQS